MKKITLKTLLKTARHKAKDIITERLISELKTVSSDLGQDPEKLSKTIKKNSKDLAKRLSKKVKYDKAALIDMNSEIKTPGIKGPVAANSKPAQASVAKASSGQPIKPPRISKKIISPSTAKATQHPALDPVITEVKAIAPSKSINKNNTGNQNPIKEKSKSSESQIPTGRVNDEESILTP